MKKNKMMRAASALLVAVLLTTSVISGTFAKYVTSDDATATARVAKWGFEHTEFDFEDLFSATYDNVASENGVNVIAPGTEGSTEIIFAPKNGAAPEVAYKFEVEASSDAFTAGNNAILNNPNIKWAFYKKGESATWGQFDQMLEAIEGMTVATVAPNTLPALADNTPYVIAWKWIFDETAANKEVNTQNNDANDTDMGNADTLAQIDLTVEITVTQLD